MARKLNVVRFERERERGEQVRRTVYVVPCLLFNIFSRVMMVFILLLIVQITRLFQGQIGFVSSSNIYL